MCSILTVVDLTKKYGQFTAVRGIGFSVPAGSIVGLLGPNGSGKSSVLHCVTGVIGVTSGTITIDGHPHQTAAAKAMLGFVPDDLALPTNLTGAEYLDLIRRLQPSCDRSLMAELLDLLGLTGALGKLVAEYSHGMKRIYALERWSVRHEPLKDRARLVIHSVDHSRKLEVIHHVHGLAADNILGVVQN